jgi:hypothetical protein
MSDPLSQPSSGDFDLMFEFHNEAGVWWAESTGWPGYSASSDSREELIVRVQKSLDLERPNARWYWTQTDVQ